MVKHVLVPLDGSGFGEQALPAAIAVAEKSRATIELVHVYDPVPPPYVLAQRPLVPDLTLDEQLRRDRLQYLAALEAWLGENTSLRVTTAMLDGAVGRTLAEYVEQREPDVIVMTTHGRGGLTRLWLGSVAQHLVQHCAVPVLLIRPDKNSSRSQTPPAFHRFLVPLDGSTNDEEAIDHALAITGARDAEITLLHVVVPVFFTGVDPGLIYPDQLDMQNVVAKYLDDVADRMRARGLAVQTRLVLDPSVAKAILECADEIKADLIALEMRPYTKLVRILTGSIADKVVRGSATPVLVHRPAVERSGLAGARTSSETESGEVF
jgi:nucleotide-binding universal stress UspA family protein